MATKYLKFGVNNIQFHQDIKQFTFLQLATEMSLFIMCAFLTKQYSFDNFRSGPAEECQVSRRSDKIQSRSSKK